MKNKNLIYIGLGALAIWYLYKKAKKTTLPGTSTSSGSGNLVTAANEIAAKQTENINFVPDTSTFADQYSIDQKNCK